MKYIVILSFLFCNLFTNAATITVASPGNGNDIVAPIQSAVNSATAGDVILLPSGSFTAIGVVTITKFLSITGQGISNTIIYRSESSTDAQINTWKDIFKFNINSTASSMIVVSGIYFKSRIPCNSSTLDGSGVDVACLDGGSLAADSGIEMVNCKDFRITGCRFDYFGNGAITVRHDDSLVGGLIDNNYFYHNSKGTAGLGLAYGVVLYGANTKWIYNPEFGTSKFIFIENNYFDYHKHSVAAGGCAKYVFRYNKVVNNIAANSAAAIDMHEGRGTAGDNKYATRAAEIYNDSIINTTFRNGSGLVADNTLLTSVASPGTTQITWLTEACIKPRGGEALIHHNYTEGYRFQVALAATAYCGGSCGAYPIAGQEGYLSGLRLGSGHTGNSGAAADGDAFIWSNTYTLYVPANSANKYFYNYNTDSVYIKHGRDYHFLASSGYTTYTYPHPFRVTADTNQSGITISGIILLTTGATVTSLYAEPTYELNKLYSRSSAKVRLDFYTSYASKQAGGAKVYPLFSGSIIRNVYITINFTDQIKASGVTLVSNFTKTYLANKLKASILTNYGYTSQ